MVKLQKQIGVRLAVDCSLVFETQMALELQALVLLELCKHVHQLVVVVAMRQMHSHVSNFQVFSELVH
eukprot:12886115-Prorocentrum_lima.AAC.1